MTNLGNVRKSELGRQRKARRETGLLSCCSCFCEQRERLPAWQMLFGGHFFGFAFLTHHFEFAFCGFEFCVDFLLDPLCRFFELG